MRVLLIEDDARLAASIVLGLAPEGIAVDHFEAAAAALEAVRNLPYAAVILGLGFSDGDGIDVLRELRARAAATLVLAARVVVGEPRAGLDVTADDYLLEPFSMKELASRLRALLRRPSAALGGELAAGALRLDTVSRLVTVRGEPVPVPRREFDALALLLRRLGKVVPKRAIEDGVYGLGDDVAANTVEVLVSRLRKRLDALGAGVAVHTLRGVGYLMIEADAPLRALPNGEGA